MLKKRLTNYILKTKVPQVIPPCTVLCQSNRLIPQSPHNIQHLIPCMALKLNPEELLKAYLRSTHIGF